MSCPSLNGIREALFSVLLDALATEEDAGTVFIAAPAQEADPNLRRIIVMASFSPALVHRQELGGYGALALRRGIWGMTISSQKDANANEPWAIAEKLEQAYRPYTVDGLEVVDGGEARGFVFCEFPYAQSVGVLPDQRNGISVTVSWWTWTHN